MPRDREPRRARSKGRIPQARLIGLLAVALLFLAGLHYYLVGPRPIAFGSPDAEPFGSRDGELSGIRESKAYRPLSGIERQRLERQRGLVREIARRHVGSELTGESESDLRVIQSILDNGVLGPDQTFELQALGVCLGDVLAASFDLEWIAYEDSIGRSRALRLGDSEVVLFPITMISKRIEAGLSVSVEDLWRDAELALAEVQPRASLP